MDIYISPGARRYFLGVYPHAGATRRIVLGYTIKKFCVLPSAFFTGV